MTHTNCFSSLKYMLFAVLIGFLIQGCGEDNTTALPSQKTTKKSYKPSGKRIFKRNCTTCHGIKGNLGINGAHDLTKSKLPLEERIKIITNGKNVMTPFKGSLKPSDIKLVAEYTQTLYKSKDGKKD